MGFDSGNNLAGMPGGAPGGVTPGSVAGAPGAGPNDPNALAGANPLPTIDEIDMSITCNPNFLRTSVSKIVASQQLANNSRLPLGVVCKPMAGDKGTNNEDVEVVDFGATGIVRCKRCRTYINPFVSWTDNGRRWRYVLRCSISTFTRHILSLVPFVLQMQHLRNAERCAVDVLLTFGPKGPPSRQGPASRTVALLGGVCRAR